MAIIPIASGQLFQSGRVNAQRPDVQPAFLRNAQVYTTDTYEFNFPSAAGAPNTFGVVRSMFIDNGDNANILNVRVAGTQQTFSVPANSAGFYTVDAKESSTISITSAANSTNLVEVIFYNYEKPPIVWYKFGPFNTGAPILVQGAMAEGATIATSTANNPLYIGGIDRGTGLFHGIAVDATGKLSTSDTVADGADVTQGAKADAAITDPTVSASVVSTLKGLLSLLRLVQPQSTQTSASASVAAAAMTPTLAAPGAGLFNYVTGLAITGGGATAGSIINATLTGLAGGTKTYSLAIPTGAILGVQLIIEFDAPLKAAGANSAVTLNVPSFGAGNTNASATLEGYSA